MPNDAQPSLGVHRPTTTRVLRAVAIAAGVVLAFAALGFLGLPPLLRPVLEDHLSAALARKVTIGHLAINPFALSATLDGVSIGQRGEGPALLDSDQLYINAEAVSLARWAPVISELKITRPVLRLVRNADGTYNVSDLIEKALAGPPGPTPRFSISNIEVVDGRFEFDDRPERQRHAVTQLKLGIPFISSLPSQTAIHVEPSFSALLDGEPVSISGDTRPFMDTHETVLHVDLAGLSLPHYLAYVPLPLPVRVESGALDAKVDVRYVARGRDPPLLTLAGTTRLTDLALRERSGQPLLRLPSLAVAIDQVDFFGRSAEIRSVALDGAAVNVRRNATGEFNFATMVPAAAAPASSSAPFRFQVGSIALRGGTLRLEDATVTPAFASTLTEVTLDVANLASGSGQQADVAFSVMSDTGAHIAHRGKLTLDPFAAAGRLDMTGLKLARLFPYYSSALNLVVDDGTLDGSTELHFDHGTLMLANLEAKASELKLRLPDEKEALWRIPLLAVHGGSVDVPKRAIEVESVEGHGATAAIRRFADGTFNFARLIRTSEHAATPAAGDETWTVQARKVAFDDFGATYSDETVTPTAHLALSKVKVRAENVSNLAKAKGRVTLAATINKRGTITLAGPLATRPLAATLDAVANGVELVPLQPYIAQSARVIVTGGTVSARGSVDYSAGTPARAGFKGDVTLGDVAILDEANATDLLKWKTLTLSGLDAQAEPLAVGVSDIALDDFFARLLLNENGEFNLQQLARAKMPAAEPPKPTQEPKTVEVATPPGTATTWLRLGRAMLSGGTIDFTDHFIRPNYSANLSGIAGTLSTLAFDQPADIDLHGNVQGSAPVEITGRINPLAENLFLDVKASATDVELPPLSPYSGKYVGYGIEKGKLSMKVRYLVDNRKLTAENSIVLDQLTFGNRIESADAIKVPVQLAVALLKDRNGVIRFDLPVAGSLDDPQFSVGGIVFRALVNLLVKIVTAPFALLGSLGGHGEELAYIEFAPGSAALDAAGQRKVDALVKALLDRPGLKLDIAGRCDPATDDDGLKRAELAREVRQQKFNDLARSGEPPASVDAVEVSPSEYEPLLARVYRAEGLPQPRNAIGIPVDVPRAEMESQILAHATISAEDRQRLATQRAQAVRERLVSGGRVPAERVYVVAPHLDASGIKDEGKAARVDFALR